jgi:hypothetical protein
MWRSARERGYLWAIELSRVGLSESEPPELQKRWAAA